MIAATKGHTTETQRHGEKPRKISRELTRINANFSDVFSNPGICVKKGDFRGWQYEEMGTMRNGHDPIH